MPHINFMHLILGFADHLIEIMGLCLAVALAFRLLASKASRRDQVYFKTFVRAVEKTLGNSEETQVDKEHVDEWLTGLFNQVVTQLPDRSIRFGRIEETKPTGEFRFRERENFTNFAEGKRSVIHGIRAHVDVLKSSYPPNFHELAYRILDQDRQWKTVAGVPIEIVSRMLEILPGLFVIGGILGTFIGIANALPMVGHIDMSHINESTPVLTAFIDNIALSMRTSISGIMYSVAMTVLNTAFPIHAQRADVEKNVTRCLEILWNRIHGETMSFADREIIGLLRQIAGQAGSNGHGDTKDFEKQVA